MTSQFHQNQIQIGIEMPSCRLAVKGRPASTESSKQGHVRVQDVSSQMVDPMLDLTRTSRNQRGAWPLSDGAH